MRRGGRSSTVDVLNGTLSRRALAVTREWASVHEEELLANWTRLRDQLPPVPIAPLE